MARGSITRYEGKNGKVSWQLRYSTMGPNGQRQYYRHTFHGTKREAQAKLTELLRQVDTKTHVDPSKVTLREYIENWFKTHQKGLAPITVRRYGNYVGHIVARLGDVPLQKLTALQVQEFVNTMLDAGVTRWGKTRGASPKSVQDCIILLKQALSQAIEWGMLSYNPAAKVRLPKAVHKEIGVLTEAQACCVLKALADTWAYMPTLIAFHTGMRMGEVLGLSWGVVDLEKGRIEVRRSCSLLCDGQPVFKEPKTRAGRRTVEIGRTLVDALRAHRVVQLEQKLKLGTEWKNDHDLVCCYDDGRYIQPSVLGLRFSRCLERMGIKGSFHGLRHTHVSLLIKAGLPINIISARVGHSNPSITHNVYSHLLPGMNRMAVDVFEQLIETKVDAMC